MTKAQVYNSIWLVIWLICLGGAIWVACAGNNVAWIFAGASLYFAVLLFLDKEGGKSIKNMLVRKLNRQR